MDQNARNIIFWVDDEPRYMKVWVPVLQDECGKERKVLYFKGVDEAVMMFKRLHDEVLGIILDIMMPPGKTFEGIDAAQDGMRTGILLMGLLGTIEPDLPVVFLSNVTDFATIASLQVQPRTKFVSKNVTPWGLANKLKGFFY